MLTQTRINQAVVSADLDGEMVLLNTETGIYFGLDAVGSEIWSMLESGLAPSAIVERMLAEYAVERDQLEADVSAFVARLVQAKLVQFTPE